MSENTTTSRSELDKLAHSLAYEYATSIIKSECGVLANEYTIDYIEWFDTTTCNRDSADDVNAALRYLELRGLLIRDCMDNNIVRFHDESEATA